MNLTTCVDISTNNKNSPNGNKRDRNGQKLTEVDKTDRNRQKYTETDINSRKQMKTDPAYSPTMHTRHSRMVRKDPKT